MRTIFIATGHNNAKAYPWSIYKDVGAAVNWTNEFLVINPILLSIMEKWIQWFRVIKVPVWLNINQRVKYVNDNSKDWDLFMEFHLDSALYAEWCTTFYFWGSTYAQNKSIDFQKEYTRITGIKWRWVKADTTTRFWRLGVIRDTKPLALLVELGFITNANDIMKIQTHWHDAIIAGIKKIII